MRDHRLILILAIVIAAPAVATDDVHLFLSASPERGAVPITGPDACTGGLRNDDGSFEGAVGYANAVQRGAYTMAFDIPPDFMPQRVCLCWTRGPFSNGTDVDFDVVFLADDGEGPKGESGFPGTELGRVPSRAENVPEFQVDGVAMYPVPLPESVRELSGRIYVGAEWQPFVNRQFFLCNDAEPETQWRPVHEGYSRVDPQTVWSTISQLRPTYRAFGTVLYGNPLFTGDFEDGLMRGDFECRIGLPGCG